MALEQVSSLIGVIIVFLLILYGSYVVSKKVAKISLKDNRSKYMKLHDRIMIGQDKYISIISIGDKYFMIGSSEDGIQMLAELEEKDLVALDSSASLPEHPNFHELLKKLGWDKEKKI